MPRPVVPGQPLHIIQRGNNRSRTFVDRQDCNVYRDVLRSASKQAGCAIHAYVLMTNHVHLLVSPEAEQSPARMIQGIGRWYVRYFNRRHRRTGTLWEGRYRSTLIDTDRYFLACSRYIELNPLRAGLVTDPAQYAWSSFQGNALGKADRLLTPHATYETLGASRSECQAAYRALFDAPLDPAVVHALRRAAKTGEVLGSARWTAHIESVLRRRVTRAPHSGTRRGEGFHRLDDVAYPSAANRFSTTLTP